jgi:eukaryotic-like serine/threonine-protein kinase
MHKGDIIGGYEILQDFIVAGGMSKISFAKKSGNEYFIKEFLSPRFPIPGSPGSPATIEKRRKNCEEFEHHHNKLNKEIAKKVAFGGNLVYAVDFFRANTSYYKVTEKIDITSFSTIDISKLTIDKILIIMKTVTHSLKILHDLNIVHGDLKPDNILIKTTTAGGYTTKLIDFDNSYFNGEPPKNTDEVVGTPEYYSPELAYYIKAGETEEDRRKLTIQSDIFALGIIFCEYLTGSKPLFNKKFNYTWEAVNNREILNFNEGLKTKKLDALVKSMLSLDIRKRPSISEVFNILKTPDLLDDKLGSGSVVDEIEPVSGLRISNNLKNSKVEERKDELRKTIKGLIIKGLNTDE